jgi:hypothetical protein
MRRLLIISLIGLFGVLVVWGIRSGEILHILTTGSLI